MAVMANDGGPVVCFGEMLVRLSTEPGGRRLAFANQLALHVGGAEANVAAALAALGHPATMVSAVPEGPLGERAVVHLRGAGVSTRHLLRAPGRMGLSLVDAAAAPGRSRVIDDRADSLFARTDWSGFDWDEVLTGARLLHVSSTALAVSPMSRLATIAAMKAANTLGVPVSFDSHVRGALWAGREDESGAIVAEALALADIAFVDHRSAALALCCDVGEREWPAMLFSAFPRLALIAHNRCQTVGVEEHRLAARVSLRDGTDVDTPERRIIGVGDRSGGGDAFAAGVIHAWLSGGDAGRMAASGLAAAILKRSQRGDTLSTTREILDGRVAEVVDA